MRKPTKHEPIKPGTYRSQQEGDPPLKVENWRLRQHLFKDCPSLTQNALAVALAIMEHRNQETGKCCPGKELLMAMARASKRQFQRAINELAQARVMYRIEGTGKKGITSRYWFAFDRDALSEVMESNNVTSNNWFW